MKKVELSELKEQVLVCKKEALAVEQNGKLLGYFYPVSPVNQAEIDKLWERLDKALAQAVVESGVEREDLINALDPSQPFPFEMMTRIGITTETQRTQSFF